MAVREEGSIAELDVDKTFDLLPLVLEVVENAENPELVSKLVRRMTQVQVGWRVVWLAGVERGMDGISQGCMASHTPALPPHLRVGESLP
jgi:hypothetical protein